MKCRNACGKELYWYSSERARESFFIWDWEGEVQEFAIIEEVPIDGMQFVTYVFRKSFNVFSYSQ